VLAVVEGFPAGLKVDSKKINKDLAKSQQGYGRGGRMKIEKDKVDLLSGFRKGVTMGSPIALLIKNKDYKIETMPEITFPRPGHADLAGFLKYGSSVRDILERASARETAARTAAGSLCKLLLEKFGIRVVSHVVDIGGIAYESEYTLGGVFEVVVLGAPVGLGSHAHFDRKLDGILAASLMSIQAIKAVEVGLGFLAPCLPGSEFHDEIFHSRGKEFARRAGYFRNSNNAGGIEGGISTGERIVVRCSMKPIPTLKTPLQSVNLKTKKKRRAAFERSDVCAVPAASVVGECVAAFVIAQAFLEKFGADSMADIQKTFDAYLKRINKM